MKYFLITIVIITVVACSSGVAQTPVTQPAAASETVMVNMRDGVKLATEIWRPRAPGKYPTIMIRLPYARTCCRIPEMAQFYTSKGYAFVSQDIRGRGDSGGTFGFWFQEQDDGYDTIEWVATQPWSSGRVGMLGGSYPGTAQWMAARSRPPHLTCIAPAASGTDPFRVFPYRGGAFALTWALGWSNIMAKRAGDQGGERQIDWAAVVRHRPLISADSFTGRELPLYREWLKHTTLDEYWRRIAFSRREFAQTNLPVLYISGWYDGEQRGVLGMWEGMRTYSPARDKQFLLIGPWTHENTATGAATKVGDLDFPDNATLDVREIHLAFFDRYLKNDSSASTLPRVRLYVTGANEWRSYDSYPITNVKYRKLYLHSGGHANSLKGDGRLQWNSPGTQPQDQYTYDPKREPVREPAPGRDRRQTQERDDVLVYTSDILTEPIEIVGRIVTELYATSDAPDTDWVISLYDVYPDARAETLGSRPGILRARYREGFDHERLLIPNRPELFRVELSDIAHQFKAGHRIRIEIASSAYPLYSLNQNTGGPTGTDTAWRVARQTVFHDRRRPSYILIPVLPRRR